MFGKNFKKSLIKKKVKSITDSDSTAKDTTAASDKVPEEVKNEKAVSKGKRFVGLLKRIM